MKKRIFLLISIMFISINFLGCIVDKTSLPTQDASKTEEIKDEEIPKEPITSKINLIAAGDIMVHSPQFRAAYNSEKNIYDFSPVFKHIKSYIEEGDISLANLETVTAGEEIIYSGFPRFNTPKEILQDIKDAGFHILSTANNHSLDQGKEGLIKTIDFIEEYGLKNIGTYKYKNEKILIEEIEGIKLGFLSYTYGLNGMDSSLTKEELSYMVNLIDERRIKEDIEKTKKLGVDVTVVFIHWGEEYHREPSDYQVELGEKIIGWGADIILGSHPHVIQESQIINKNGKDKFIIYSMGNFLSNQRYESLQNSYTEDGVIVNLSIEKNFDSGETLISDVEYTPTWVNRYKSNGKLFYEILPVKDVLEGKIKIINIDKVEERLKRSYKNTMDKMSKN